VPKQQLGMGGLCLAYVIKFVITEGCRLAKQGDALLSFACLLLYILNSYTIAGSIGLKACCM
jgi:hypothetical protein